MQNTLIDFVHDRYVMKWKPDGTRQNPARSCADLILDHPELESGENMDLKILRVFNSYRRLN